LRHFLLGQVGLNAFQLELVTQVFGIDGNPSSESFHKTVLADIPADCLPVVARTERSITDWCQPNRTGVARLDAYFDPNERKYFISPQSVELAIAEEKAKAAKINEPTEQFGKNGSEAFRTIPHDTETRNKTEPGSEADTDRLKELERENMDLKITNRGKDYLIEKLQDERKDFFEQVISANRKVGELENRLLQLGDGENNN
jgi:hypothetical protein